ARCSHAEFCRRHCMADRHWVSPWVQPGILAGARSLLAYDSGSIRLSLLFRARDSGAHEPVTPARAVLGLLRLFPDGGGLPVSGCLFPPANHYVRGDGGYRECLVELVASVVVLRRV